MQLYKNRNEDLQDCGPTINFIDRFHKLITAMSKHTVNNALAPHNNSSKVFFYYKQMQQHILSLYNFVLKIDYHRILEYIQKLHH